MACRAEERRVKRPVVAWTASASLIEGDPLESLAGDSTIMRSLRSLVRRVAASDSTVLVLGESGTGKELVAQSIHRLSTRERGAFVPVNCGAIPHELLESELFGHTKGAFTGALTDRRGRFEMANSGTLFLDEIGDMRLEMQVKLLRVLQERAIDRVGDDRPFPVDVRIIAATHRHLEDAIGNGEFRADLYYRLNVIPLYVPPLRERDQDVLLLFDHFARRSAGKDCAPVRAGHCLQEWMVGYDWPGNCRELLNFVERLSVLWPSEELTLTKIPSVLLPRKRGSVAPTTEEQRAVLDMWQWDESAEKSTPVEGGADAEASLAWAAGVAAPALPAAAAKMTTVDLKKLLSDYEAAWIREAMRVTLGNITHAAELLGLPRTTFIERLRKYEPSAFRQ
ncbi:MAG: sigma-54-dependent Fis family transcriptional regulator [Gammaproteobacteria bacterium]|nr:sigma-54-dependent Fis family transcriptional regulator [Gammaproteobacteria bacterium]